MFAEIALYGGLFLNAFIAATLLPAFSEVSFAALLTAQTGTALGLYLSVTTGNVLGALLNYSLGLRIVTFQNRAWFPFKAEQISSAAKHFERFGKWSLLFAWLPIVGDPLTLAAGVLRTNLRFFLLAVTFGKALRYAIIWATIEGFLR